MKDQIEPVERPIEKPTEKPVERLVKKPVKKIVNLRQLLFATLMGSIALAIRNAGLYVMVFPPFRIDPRWIFSLLGACWTGPVGGLITGVLAAYKPPYPAADLACIPIHFLIGLISVRFIRGTDWKHLLSIFLWPILGLPLYLLTFSIFYSPPFAISYIPVILFIGISTAIPSFLIGIAVEKRAPNLLNFLQV